MRTIRRDDRAVPIVLVLFLMTIAIAACAGSTGGAAATAGPPGAPVDKGDGLQGLDPGKARAPARS